MVPNRAMSEDSIVVVETEVLGDEQVARVTEDDILEELKVTEEQIKKIENETRGQSKNEN